jgi:hypothetical protein
MEEYRRHSCHVTLQKENNCSCFEGKLGGYYEINCTITEYEARGRAFSKGGGNVTVLASHVTWSRALARHRRCGAAELVIYIRTEPCK